MEGHDVRVRQVGRNPRLAAEPRLVAASTFRNLKEAETVVASAIRANSASIKTWASSASVGQTKAFSYSAGKVIGEGVVRSSGQLQNMSNMVVVVRKVQVQNRLYFVLTAYPKI